VGWKEVLFDWLYPETKTKISKLEKTITGRDEDLLLLGLQIRGLNEKVQELQNLLIEADNELDDADNHNSINPTNIPSANITYKRPVLIEKNKWIQVEIDVRNFIMPDFEIVEKLKQKGLIYTGKENLDELIPKVYLLAKTAYKYGGNLKYGFREFWMFPFELRAVLSKKKAGDCEDWAITIGSYFAAARIPRNRWLVSAGKARNGIGHATFYAKDSTGTWRHLNSTTGFSFPDLKDYPDNKSEKDHWGIAEDGFWFSFNDWFSIHKFESKEAQDSFKEADLPIKIVAEAG